MFGNILFANVSWIQLCYRIFICMKHTRNRNKAKNKKEKSLLACAVLAKTQYICLGHTCLNWFCWPLTDSASNYWGTILWEQKLWVHRASVSKSHFIQFSRLEVQEAIFARVTLFCLPADGIIRWKLEGCVCLKFVFYLNANRSQCKWEKEGRYDIL